MSKRLTIAGLLQDLRPYQREHGTAQCLQQLVVYDRTRTHSYPRYWAVCFREKGHAGPHRHWFAVDFETHKGQRLTMTLSKIKREKVR